MTLMEFAGKAPIIDPAAFVAPVAPTSTGSASAPGPTFRTARSSTSIRRARARKRVIRP